VGGLPDTGGASVAEGPLAAKKTFSYEEAVALLPEVQRLTDDAHRKVEALGQAAVSGSSTGRSVEGEVSAIVTGWARALVTMGLEVKGLWLVDFDNGSGYYCWQYPEPALQFYHSYEDGFRGRMRIQ
jgi:hypothetical protein